MKQFLLSLLFLVPVLVWGQFGPQQVIYEQYGFWLKSITAGDIDGDMDIDVLGAFSNFQVYKNDGSENFQREFFTSDDPESAEDIIIVDLDKDSDQDILIAGIDNVYWHENIANDSFTDKKIISGELYDARTIQVGDIDGDNDLDVVSASYIHHTILWFSNQGNESFLTDTVFHENDGRQSRIASIVLEDIDKDDDLDIFAAFYDRVVWFRNDGNGNFSEQIIITNFVRNGYSLKLDDFDQDGNLDLLVADQEKIAWYASNESQEFSEAKIIITQINAQFSSVDVADFDKDGDIDVVSSAYNLNVDAIVWYQNNGNGDFGLPIPIDNSGVHTRFARMVIASDIDGDSDKDIIYTTSGKVAWVENRFEETLISGITFFDENSNGIFDENEEILHNLPIFLESDLRKTYAYSDGEFIFYVSNGTYTLTAQPDSCWQLTTDSMSYNITVDGEPVLDRNFGFTPASDYTHLQPRLSSAPTRCGFEVPFWLSVENDGCQPTSGQYALVLDDLVTYLGGEVEPDAINGDTLFWNFDRLIPSRVEQFKLNFQIAGTEFIGDTIRLQALAFVEDNLGNRTLSDVYEFTSEIRCAYDPNDKLVKPLRTDEYEQNYTLFDETIEYTIRFRNTGNDTAFTVVLKDYLDENLDWNTFRPIAASHPYEVYLYKDGLVEFTFDNILLPDSTTNEPLSHGYVMFKINAKESLPENTVIENKADIFFDFNPPIETNTTASVLVSELPKVTSTFYADDELRVHIFPNPFHDQLRIELTDLLDTDCQLHLFDATGRRAQSAAIRDQAQSVSTASLPKGLYFYQLIDQSGRLLATGKLVRQ